MCRCIISKFIMWFDRELDLEKYYGRILSSRVRILVNKQRLSRQYALCAKIYNVSPDESDQCSNITGLGFAMEPSPDQTAMQPPSSNIYECNYSWQQILTRLLMKMNINRA